MPKYSGPNLSKHCSKLLQTLLLLLWEDDQIGMEKLEQVKLTQKNAKSKLEKKAEHKMGRVKFFFNSLDKF